MQTRLTSDLNVVSSSNLEITLLDGDLNIIQKLDDEPNDVGGLTPAQLKAKFDEAGNAIKDYINGTLIPEILAEEATEEARIDAESTRQTQEAARVAAETARSTAEEERATAESTRQTNETARTEAEGQRAAAETARANAEAARTAAESARAATEQTRVNQETARAEAETARASAEADRASHEGTRQTQETARQNAEAARAAAEAARVTAEAARVTAENARCVWADYSPETSYIPGHKVLYLGSSYVNTVACQGVLPTDTAHWQLIAAKGVDGQGAGDMKAEVYDATGAVSLVGGIVAYTAGYAAKRADSPVAGHLATLDAEGNVVDSGKAPVPADIGAAPLGVTVTFTEESWTGSAAPYTLSIAASTHKRLSGDFLFDVWALSDGKYCKNTWAVQELEMEYTESDGTFALISDTKFAGKIVFVG